jgi:hypothetical protein
MESNGEWFVQPEQIGIKGHHLLSSSGPEKRMLERKVAQEMFEGITREVVEETGIPASFLVKIIALHRRAYKT